MNRLKNIAWKVVSLHAELEAIKLEDMDEGQRGDVLTTIAFDRDEQIRKAEKVAMLAKSPAVPIIPILQILINDLQRTDFPADVAKERIIQGLLSLKGR